MARETAADRVAEEVTIRLEVLATRTADAILESIYRPQVVDPTSDQALDYWQTILVPGGQFSPAGRDKVVAQAGAPEYRAICEALARREKKRRKDAGQPVPETPAPAPAEAGPPEGTPVAPLPAGPPLQSPPVAA